MDVLGAQHLRHRDTPLTADRAARGGPKKRRSRGVSIGSASARLPSRGSARTHRGAHPARARDRLRPDAGTDTRSWKGRWRWRVIGPGRRGFPTGAGSVVVVVLIVCGAAFGSVGR
ncbi:hypothetical protein TU94_22970 [Streptomyces cyaneogriseus subsp. noncyanogenus]|uniref:Uncharacterized protein n=1 Tax=Streptomyces cyaneogriseus subsp. noncyanogenus TaxID=477245 RepID=A0A0C5G6M2_9ACTN|nr:hypothetical protein TU94_22970 [Streptomyces cyaneogriseus subsp. noncyanogenus]